LVERCAGVFWGVFGFKADDLDAVKNRTATRASILAAVSKNSIFDFFCCLHFSRVRLFIFDEKVEFRGKFVGFLKIMWTSRYRLAGKRRLWGSQKIDFF
jgi:hypothetical protein